MARYKDYSYDQGKMTSPHPRIERIVLKDTASDNTTKKSKITQLLTNY